jgi:hypothetical protein
MGTEGSPDMRVICPLAGSRSSAFFRLRRAATCPARIGRYLKDMTLDDEQEFQVVYQGFDPMLAGMFARMLESEGISCRHVGTQFPAEIGVGALGCEQRLEVPSDAVSRARELLVSAGATNEG